MIARLQLQPIETELQAAKMPVRKRPTRKELARLVNVAKPFEEGMERVH